MKIYSEGGYILIWVMNVSILRNDKKIFAGAVERSCPSSDVAFGIRRVMSEDSSLRDRGLQSRDAVELLSDKWRITLLHLLTPGPQRAKVLQQAIAKISPKVLTQTLRGMERDGLISRKIYPNVPPRVDYQLTEMGASLIDPLKTLCLWAEAHAEDRDRARREFDARKKNSD